MRERRGPLGRAAGGVAATVRRLQQAREPRLVLYDDAGHPRLVGPDEADYDPLIDVCERLVEHAEAARPGPPPEP